MGDDTAAYSRQLESVRAKLREWRRELGADAVETISDAALEKLLTKLHPFL